MKREQRVFGNEDINNNAKHQMSNVVSWGENKFPTRLSGEYNSGYRKAIMDVIEVFSYFSKKSPLLLKAKVRNNEQGI